MLGVLKFIQWQCTLWSISSCTGDPTVVSLSNGKYMGEKRDYFIAFEGIPYAEAPIGENRFESPKPYTETWTGIRDAKTYGSHCLQWDHLTPLPNRLQGAEDCLFLNVYVPDSVIRSGMIAPVVFFIHGGGFMWGGSSFYTPMKMMEQDVILVTFNYRLGPLGFMSTQDEVMPGNFGSKDQAMALKWVNENIFNFQGDNKRITVAGWSAGGASTHLFYMSPLTKNLFKNGVSHSGCALNPWVIQENALEKAHKVANHLNCPTDDNVAMLKCFKEQPAEKIVSSVAIFQPFLYNPFSPFGMVVEPPSENAFLLEFPSKLLEKGNIYKAPWIASATLDEGLYPAAEFASNEEYLPKIAKDWDKLAQDILDYNGTSTDQMHKTMIAEVIRMEYFEKRTMTPENFHDLTRIMSDRMYNYGLSKAVQIQSLIHPTYFYFYQFKSVYALGEMMSGGRTDLGVAHGDDVFIIFPLAGRIPLNAEEEEMSSNLIHMYIKFANGNEAQFGGVPMTPVLGKTINYMDIKSPSQIQMNFFGEEVYGNQKFWDKELNYHLEN